MTDHFSADTHPILPGRKFWDKNLRVVTVTATGVHSNAYPGMTDQTWHRTTGGEADSYAGIDRKWGGLAKWFEGRNADDYPDGTEYADIK